MGGEAIRYLLLVMLLAATPAASGAADDVYVWWEAERPRNTNFPSDSWFSARDDERGHLSGGYWLTNDGERGRQGPYARYAVDVPEDGIYDFWVRKFWKHGPFRWRFDEQPWTVCGRDVTLADHVDIRPNVCANWVHLGSIDLDAGQHDFRFELVAEMGESIVAGFDCFVLARGGFAPNGRFRPGERSNLAAPGWFAYEPDRDRFPADAILDLRRLNESHAGFHGFVQSADDGTFRLGDGRPVRFWAVNISADNAAGHRGSVDYLARRLAKLGVNMVRYHAPLWSDEGAPDEVDDAKLDDLHYLVHAMKREGIYTQISFYFPVWMDMEPRHGLTGYESGNKHPFGVIYFEPRFQRMYLAWLTAILATENPYERRPLAQEPAVALLELVNEDSLFFWTFSRSKIPDESWTLLARRFGDWIVERYGSFDDAYTAWGGARDKNDDPAAGLANVTEAWGMTREGLEKSPRRHARYADQVRFLAELQHDFYAAVSAYAKDELGYGGLVVPGNWKTADAALLDAVEHYTYTAGDVQDRHAYWDPRHEGKAASYSVREGDRFDSRSVLHDPAELPVQFVQTEGYPHIMSELGWPNPNRFRAEATAISGAYASLQGLDGLVFFAVQTNSLRDVSMRKFGLATPSVIESFPAAALMYRRGDVRTPDPVERHALPTDVLFGLRATTASAAQGLDALRRRDVGSASGDDDAFDRRRFLVGPVVQTFSEGESLTFETEGIDDEAHCVTSVTDELAWNWDRGVLTIDTERTQGAVGFLAEEKPIVLRDVTIECRNEYASILVTSLDDVPLAGSEQILIQVVTEDRPYGFETEGDRIVALGGSPYNMREIDVDVVFPGATGTWRLLRLDAEGRVFGDPIEPTVDDTDRRRYTLDPTTVHHVLVRLPG